MAPLWVRYCPRLAKVGFNVVLFSSFWFGFTRAMVDCACWSPWGIVVGGLHARISDPDADPIPFPVLLAPLAAQLVAVYGFLTARGALTGDAAESKTLALRLNPVRTSSLQRLHAGEDRDHLALTKRPRNASVRGCGSYHA